MIYAAKRIGLGSEPSKRGSRKHDRRYPEVLIPGEKVQIDIKEVPYHCLKGSVLRDENTVA